MNPRWICALVLSVPLGLTACRDSRVAAYRIPKEHDAPVNPSVPAPATAPAGMTGLAVSAAESGGLEWSAPATWQAKPPSAMRKGSYNVGGEGTAGADLAITAFPGDVGGDLANVNRWRGQLSLPPIAEADLSAALTSLTNGAGVAMKLVDLTGGAQRMLGAIVPHAGATWFFKLTGPEAVVAKEKSVYLEFLQTVRAATAATTATPTDLPPAPDMGVTPVAKADGPGLKWTAPAHWQEKPGSAMRKATLVIAGANGATGEVSVTAFPGGVGGELANLNRWRGQLSLPPVAEAEFAGAVTRLEVNGLTVTVADLTGGTDNPQRMLGAMVPYAGATWFFKLTGPPSLVATEKPAFLAFLQTLSAP